MNDLQQTLSQTFLGIPLANYAMAFGAILAGFVARWILNAVLQGMERVAERGASWANRIVFNSLLKPVSLGCVIGGIYIATLMLPLPEAPVNIRHFCDALAKAFTAFLVVWVLVRMLDGLMDYWAEAASKTETKLDDQLVPIVRSSGKTFLVVIGGVLFLQNIGYSVSSLLAGVGIGGAALAFASKDTLSNLFGSIVLFVDRPFQIGDWIQMGEVEGTVEEVGLRVTRVRTFANSLITLPNALFTTQAINNWSLMHKRRIKMSIGVTYDTPPDKIRQAVERIRSIIRENEKIHDDFFLVNFDNFGPHSLDIFIYCFTVTTNWEEFMNAKQEFILSIMDAFQDMGIEFAFPTQTLHIASMPGEPPAMHTERPE